MIYISSLKEFESSRKFYGCKDWVRTDDYNLYDWLAENAVFMDSETDTVVVPDKSVIKTAYGVSRKAAVVSSSPSILFHSYIEYIKHEDKTHDNYSNYPGSFNDLFRNYREYVKSSVSLSEEGDKVTYSGAYTTHIAGFEKKSDIISVEFAPSVQPQFLDNIFIIEEYTHPKNNILHGTMQGGAFNTCNFILFLSKVFRINLLQYECINLLHHGFSDNKACSIKLSQSPEARKFYVKLVTLLG